jgi:hypothetical protein
MEATTTGMIVKTLIDPNIILNGKYNIPITKDMNKRERFGAAIEAVVSTLVLSPETKPCFHISPATFGKAYATAKEFPIKTKAGQHDLPTEIKDPPTLHECNELRNLAEFVATGVFEAKCPDREGWRQAFDEAEYFVDMWLKSHMFQYTHTVPRRLHSVFHRAVAHRMSDHWHREKHFNGAPQPWGHIDSAGIVVREQCNLVLQDFATNQACETLGASPHAAEKRPRDADPDGADKKSKPDPKTHAKKAKDCTRSELEVVWKGKNEDWQLQWAKNNCPECRNTIDNKMCILAGLPVGYSDKTCPGPGHVTSYSGYKPEHGKCIVQKCTSRTTHITKDSAECMKVVHHVIAVGRKAFVVRGKG